MFLVAWDLRHWPTEKIRTDKPQTDKPLSLFVAKLLT